MMRLTNHQFVHFSSVGTWLLAVTLALVTCTLYAQSDDALPGLSTSYLAPEATESFHSSDTAQLVWQDDDAFQQLLVALEGLWDHGLNPAHYHLALLQELRFDRVQRDRYATDAWFSAAAHMLYGKLNPLTVEPDWTAAGRNADLAGTLRQALADGTVATSLEQLAPQQRQYQALLSEYRTLRQQDAAPIVTVPTGPILGPGMAGERVAALQQRLQQLQLLDPGFTAGQMDRVTVAATRLFQESEELDPDGLVGPLTLAVLNLGQQQKLEKIRVNLERWRWLPDQLGRRHVQVNIAAFSVSSWENETLVETHLAVVGKTYRETPVFSDQIEYLVLNPWWEVPYSIARIDKLPLFRQEPETVTAQGFEILDRDGQVLAPESIDWNRVSQANFPYRLRQAPGEYNALGRVKIMFPNEHNVYLHDTPTQELFEQRQRAFSSGCIRIQSPLDFSQWLLTETPGWDRQRIDSVVASGLETRVDLAARVPVHILYHTAVSEAGGRIRYLDDIYQRDAAVLDGLLASHH